MLTISNYIEENTWYNFGQKKPSGNKKDNSKYSLFSSKNMKKHQDKVKMKKQVRTRYLTADDMKKLKLKIKRN